jgi:2-polyprenyl-3-methyl-5-hydroxy-6-metoxy-1,4-benzoquinol methylase
VPNSFRTRLSPRRLLGVSASAGDTVMRYSHLSPDQQSELRHTLVHEFYAKTRHYAGWQLYNAEGPAHFDTDDGKGELDRQVSGRLQWFRATHVPWLATQMRLDGARVLEVGAGTGISTVALLEAGAAHVDALDLDGPALVAARARVRLHGLSGADFHHLNATEIARLAGRPYDLILFFATIEHMTHQERMAALPAAWSMLGGDAVLCVLDTPNRLWFNDRHTGMMPFFHWLPDDVAVDYARFSPRQTLSEDFASTGPDAAERLARWGRGISFHDFELWFGRDELAGASGMDEYHRSRDPAWAEVWAQTPEGRFYAFLQEAAPHIPGPFFGEALNLALRRPGR